MYCCCECQSYSYLTKFIIIVLPCKRHVYSKCDLTFLDCFQYKHTKRINKINMYFQPPNAKGLWTEDKCYSYLGSIIETDHGRQGLHSLQAACEKTMIVNLKCWLLCCRSHAIACVNQFIISRTQALMLHIDPFIEASLTASFFFLCLPDVQLSPSLLSLLPSSVITCCSSENLLTFYLLICCFVLY